MNPILLPRLLGLFCLCIAALTLTGHVQQVISFEDGLNEIFFFIFALMCGIIFLVVEEEPNRNEIK